MKVYLTAREGDDDLAEAWQHMCGSLDFVEVYRGSILGLDVDAVVSPANSFGFMDGGIDWLYTQHFGGQVQEQLQRTIHMERNGELLVGEAQTIETLMSCDIPYVICAPTMRVPMILGDTTINPYLAAKAALREAVAYELESIAFPGLGTGVGKVPPHICAHQMRMALNEIIVNKDRITYPGTWQQAQAFHQSLYLKPAKDLQYDP